METIPAKELDSYVQDSNSLIIDLRPHEEYVTAHIRGAVNVPYGRFRNELRDRRRTVILYCERGGMSMSVARELEQRGYRTKSVVGGFRAYRGKNMVRSHDT